jgi:2-amino-4-hydroxy-6-hydroxymethyldihydropteridine diphosphokinase
VNASVAAAIALGSNLDDPREQVLRAFEEIARLPSTQLTARSRLYRTAPVGIAHQPDFVNACARVETTLGPRELLEALLAIERRHGRVRTVPNGPRTLDLDLLLYGDAVLEEPGLTVPHPHLHERAFALAPLVDAWPEAIVPGRGPARELLGRVDRAGVSELEPSVPKEGAP